MLTLKDILEIENTPEILKFTCPGTDYLLWPVIRHTVIRMVIDAVVFSEETLIKTNAVRSVSRFQQLKCLADGLIHNLRFLTYKPQILFFNSGVTNVNIDGKYINRVSDYFAFCYPNSTLLIEDAHEWQHLSPRANQNVAYHIPFRVVPALVGRYFSTRVEGESIPEFTKFIDARLELILGFKFNEQQIAYLGENLFRFCSKLKTELSTYETLYSRLNPKLIFFEDGCYGFHGHLIRLAKEMGIKTAEVQHGLVSSGHSAYNFASTILQSIIYRQYTPEHFLVYGEFWANHICVPSQVIVVGNPYYDMMKLKYHNGNVGSIGKLLLLSSGDNFQKDFELAHELKKVLSKHDIMIRPHPAEKSIVLKTYGRGAEGILIDDGDDLYSQIAQSSVVVGEISTALFEAIGITKKIFAMNTPLNVFWSPESPFESFTTVDQLAAKLSKDDCGVVDPVLARSIWASDWEKNYRNFIANHVGLNLN